MTRPSFTTPAAIAAGSTFIAGLALGIWFVPQRTSLANERGPDTTDAERGRAEASAMDDALAGARPRSAGSKMSSVAAAPAVSTESANDASTRATRTALEQTEAAARADDPVEDLLPPELSAELQSYLNSGRLLNAMQGDGDAAREFLLTRYRQEGDHEALLALLESVGTMADWSKQANIWMKAEMLPEATRGYERSLRARLSSEPPADLSDYQVRRELGELSKIDPELALTIAAERVASSPPEDTNARIDLAKLYIRAGHLDSARPLLEDALAHPIDGVTALQSLVEIAPELAEAELRRRLNADPNDTTATPLLVQVLSAPGREEELIATMDAALLGDPLVAGRTLAAVLNNAPVEAWAEHWPEWMAQLDREQAGPSWELNEALGSAAERLLQDEATREAGSEMYLAVLDAAATGDNENGWLPNIPDELMPSLAPAVEAALPRIEATAGMNDELWGDIGDRYRSLGRMEDAQRCWEEALRIDPTDGEWQSNLRDLYAGRDPD